MNERIKELIELSTTTEVIHGRGFDTTQYTSYFDKEKFAELIVKECLHIVDDEGAGEGGCIRAMIRIQEEFGVEA